MKNWGLHLASDALAASPTPSPSASSAPPCTINGAAASSCAMVSQLLAQREGFGRNTVGGINGQIVQVTSDADSGPGSLREVIANAAGRPIWVTFASDMIIQLQSNIVVPSYVTIDGRGHRVEIRTYGFLISNGAHDVIVTHLSMDGELCPGYHGTTCKVVLNADGEAPDGFSIENSENVWVDHVDLTNYSDKLVGIRYGSRNLTFSWDKFYNQDKAMIIGSGGDSEVTGDAFQYYALDSNMRITVHHSSFEHTVQRSPRIGYATVHMYNNVNFDWSFYVMSADLESDVVLENSIFDTNSERANSTCSYPDNINWETIEQASGKSPGNSENFCKAIRYSNYNASPELETERALYDALMRQADWVWFQCTNEANKNNKEIADICAKMTEYYGTSGTDAMNFDYSDYTLGGHLRASGNLFLHSASSLSSQLQNHWTAFTPDYCYSLETADGALEDRVRNGDGNQSVDPAPLIPSTCPSGEPESTLTVDQLYPWSPYNAANINLTSGDFNWDRGLTFVEAATYSDSHSSILSMTEASTASGYHAIRSYFTGSSLAPWKVSVVFTPVGNRSLYLNIANSANLENIAVLCDPTSSAPVIQAGASKVTSSSLKALGNGSYQCEFQGVPDSTATGQTLIRMDIATASGQKTSYAGDGRSGINLSSVSIQQAP